MATGLLQFDLRHSSARKQGYLFAGVGIYPTGALINHSCRPNAVQVFDGASIQFRAVERIAEGLHPTHLYVGPPNPGVLIQPRLPWSVCILHYGLFYRPQLPCLRLPIASTTDGLWSILWECLESTRTNTKTSSQRLSEDPSGGVRTLFDSSSAALMSPDLVAGRAGDCHQLSGR